VSVTADAGQVLAGRRPFGGGAPRLRRDCWRAARRRLGVNATLFVVLLVDAIGSGLVSTWLTLIAAIIGSVIFEAAFRVRR
jgi:hypothetical protein